MISRFANGGRKLALRQQSLMNPVAMRFFGSALMDMDATLIDGSSQKFKDLVKGKKAIFITNVASE